MLCLAISEIAELCLLIFSGLHRNSGLHVLVLYHLVTVENVKYVRGSKYSGLLV